MREIVEGLRAWADRRYAIATVIGVRGSAPRPPGATLAVAADGQALGSVSGGCVEGAVYELAGQVLADGRPVRQRFGYSADDAFAVGLTCGGEIEVLVRPADALDREMVAADGPVAVARLLAPVAGDPGGAAGRGIAVYPDRVSGGVGVAALDAALSQQARTMLTRGTTGRVGVGGVEVFVQTLAEPAQLLIYGAIDYAAALARIGSFLGYRVTVCDARAVFATPARFPAADEVVVDWPHRHLARTPTDGRTVIAVLTHDAKFDIPLLAEALRREVGYVGALGSRRTDEQRRARLRAAGLTGAELAGLRSPIGLDLGARTPEETALSIAAEIVAARSGAGGRALSATGGPIHPDGAQHQAGGDAPSGQCQRIGVA